VIYRRLDARRYVRWACQMPTLAAFKHPTHPSYIIHHPLARTYYTRHMCVQKSRYCGTSGKRVLLTTGLVHLDNTTGLKPGQQCHDVSGSQTYSTLHSHVALKTFDDEKLVCLQHPRQSQSSEGSHIQASHVYGDDILGLRPVRWR
jgi:hypothetical protein